jgi:HEAT repeat protein
MIAVIVVGGLVLTFYATSDAMAMQRVESKPVAQLAEIVGTLKSGIRPRQGRPHDRVIAATLALGKGQDEIPQRIDALAVAGSVSDSPFESAAQIALQQLGPVTHDHLDKLLQSNESEDVTKAIVCIRLLGREAARFVPKLVEMVDSGDPTITRLGVFALQDMGPDAVTAVESFKEVIHALDFNAQIMVCKAVVGIGRDAAPLADHLAQIFEQGIPSSRSWAGIALGAIGPIENFDTAKMLGSRIDAAVHVEKVRALQGLALMGDEATSQIDLIKAAMDQPESRIRPEAAYAYYRVTGQTEAAVQTLVQLLSSKNQREVALDQLKRMGAAAKMAIPAVSDLLSHEHVGVREQAVLVLGSMGSAAAEKIDAIQKLESDPDPLLRQAVQESIAAIKNDANERSDSIIP